MNLAPENLEAISAQPSNHPHVSNAPEAEHPPRMARTATQLVDDGADLTRANESVVLHEQTMVASVEDDREREDAFQVIQTQPDVDMVDSDPLRNPRPTHFSVDPKEAQDVTVVEEEVDIVNSNGQTLYPDIYTKPSPTASKGASHLRLNLKPPSPQPWELVEPPSEETGKEDRRLYSVGGQKFDVVQSARCVLRKLKWDD